MRVPDGLGWWSAEDGGAEWLAALPGLAAECAERWDLRLGDPFEPATISLVVPAERRDGTPAVLKITFPEYETEHEAAALAHWNGDGAARLLEADAGAPGAAGRAARSGPEAEQPARRGGGEHDRGRHAAAPVVDAARAGCAVHASRRGGGDVGRRERAPAADPAAPRRPRRRLRARAAAEPRRAGGPAPGLPHRQHAARRERAAGSRSTPSRWSASARSTARRWCATAARS